MLNNKRVVPGAAGKGFAYLGGERRIRAGEETAHLFLAPTCQPDGPLNGYTSMSARMDMIASMVSCFQLFVRMKRYAGRAARFVLVLRSKRFW